MKITRSQLKQLIAEELNVGVPTASMEENADSAERPPNRWTIEWPNHGASYQRISLTPEADATGQFARDPYRFNNISELVAHITQADSDFKAAGIPGFMVWKGFGDWMGTWQILAKLEEYQQELIALSA